MKIEQLKADVRKVLNEWRELADVAEGRSYTADEKGRLAYLQKQAETLQARIKTAESDAEVMRRIQDLGSSMDGYGGDAKLPALPQRGWYKAVKDQMNRLGQKDLVPGGSVLVPNIPLNPISSGAPVVTALDFFPREGLTGDGVAYLRETARVHAAAAVADKARKPTSTYTLVAVTDRARVIAHLSEPVPKRFLDDAPALRRYLDLVMIEGVNIELESQVIDGNGAGENMTGMLQTPGIQAVPWAGDILTTTRQALTRLDVEHLSPSGWIVHPEDWEAVELLQDDEKRYYFYGTNGGQLPVDRGLRRLWGVPVGLTVGCPRGVAILGDFRTATTLYEAQQIRLDWSEAFSYQGAYDETPASGFEHNLVKWRAEGRWVLAVNRPMGIVEVELEASS